MTTDIDQEERDFIDAAMTMPPGAWGIADYYRIQRLRKLANKQAAAKAALETQQREGK